MYLIVLPFLCIVSKVYAGDDVTDRPQVLSMLCIITAAMLSPDPGGPGYGTWKEVTLSKCDITPSAGPARHLFQADRTPPSIDSPNRRLLLIREAILVHQQSSCLLLS